MTPGADDDHEPLEVIELEPSSPAARSERAGPAGRSGAGRRRGPVIVAVVVVVALVVSVVASRSHRHGKPTDSPSTSNAGRTVIRLHGGGLFPFRVGARVLTAGDDGLRVVDTDTGHVGVPSIAGLPPGPATVVASSDATVAVRVDGQMYWFTLADGIAHRVDATTAFSGVQSGQLWLAGARYATAVPGDPNRLPRTRVATTAPAIGATRRGLLERASSGYVIQPTDGTRATMPFLPASARVIGVHADRVAWVPPACGVLRCPVHVTEVSSGATTSWVQLVDHPSPLALADTIAVFEPDGGRVAIVVPDNNITKSTSLVVADLHNKQTARVDTTGYITPPARPGSDDGAGATVVWTGDGSYLVLAPAAGTGVGRLAVIDPDTGRISSARVPLDLGSSAAVVGDSTLGALPPPHRLGQLGPIATDFVPPPRPGVQVLAADDNAVDVLDLDTFAVRSIDLGAYEPNPAGPNSIARVTGGWLVVRGGGVVDLIRDGATDARLVDAGTQVYATNGGRTAWITATALDRTVRVESFDPATGAIGTPFSVFNPLGASDLGIVITRGEPGGTRIVLVDAAGREHSGPLVADDVIDVLAVAGRRLLYGDGSSLHALDLGTGQNDRLWNAVPRATLSADGETAAWITTTGDGIVGYRFRDRTTATITPGRVDRLVVADDGTFWAIKGQTVYEGQIGARSLQPYEGLSPALDARRSRSADRQQTSFGVGMLCPAMTDETGHDAGEAITIRANESGQLWQQSPQRWRALSTEAECPWCQGPGPPEEDVIAETEMCWVTAPTDATLPGYVCISTKRHVVEPYELDDRARDSFFADAMAVARGLARSVQPMKMNYEIHGNTVPHLHMHLFPRFAGDPYVGYAITNRVWFTRTPEQLEQIASAVRAELAACGRLV